MHRNDEQKNERIAVLETEVKNMNGWMKAIDTRLRAVERNVWIGYGLFVAADIAVRIFFK